ncbi:MAG TPA: inositol-3-phosphate synthase, partial [Acidimicrobiales bacterium]|nr:inositol-3-phosphate synthase [Acidimicrobiales bacterium]
MTPADRPTIQPPVVKPVEGRLGVLTVGMGAVASTLVAGVELTKRGMGEPIGSLTQMGTIRLGKRTERNVPLIKDFAPLASLDDLVFGCWDPFPDDAYVAAQRAGVLDAGRHLETVAEALREVRPMKAAFDPRYVKRLDGPNVKENMKKRAALEGLREDINRFKEQHQLERVVMIWCGSTEIFLEPSAAHMDLDSFEKAIDNDDLTIAPSMLYAYAALQEGVPFING